MELETRRVLRSVVVAVEDGHATFLPCFGKESGYNDGGEQVATRPREGLSPPERLRRSDS